MSNFHAPIMRSLTNRQPVHSASYTILPEPFQSVVVISSTQHQQAQQRVSQIDQEVRSAGEVYSTSTLNTSKVKICLIEDGLSEEEKQRYPTIMGELTPYYAKINRLVPFYYLISKNSDKAARDMLTMASTPPLPPLSAGVSTLAKFLSLVENYDPLEDTPNRAVQMDSHKFTRLAHCLVAYNNTIHVWRRTFLGSVAPTNWFHSVKLPILDTNAIEWIPMNTDNSISLLGGVHYDANSGNPGFQTYNFKRIYGKTFSPHNSSTGVYQLNMTGTLETTVISTNSAGLVVSKEYQKETRDDNTDNYEQQVQVVELDLETMKIGGLVNTTPLSKSTCNRIHSAAIQMLSW
ncbi:1690_t:CDS:2 [Ambispora gerdemannii]|uniref:1690_t:CDS:1 n=1 Tax=Ambispora gerdemannii TaxID=144530 RepID=A0A9N9FSY8_9GLOM|nr:1690_t:CDS:2 [Ambispora gerdemannii]